MKLSKPMTLEQLTAIESGLEAMQKLIETSDQESIDSFARAMANDYLAHTAELLKQHCEFEDWWGIRDEQSGC